MLSHCETAALQLLNDRTVIKTNAQQLRHWYNFAHMMNSASTHSTSAFASGDDLTAKARIRNTALTLFAAGGMGGTSMRAIATASGVTVGLVAHHYGTKEKLREAVELRIVETIAEAIASVPVEGSSRDIRVARDAAVAKMLAAHPEVVDYLRRTLLDVNGDNGRLLERLADLAANEVHKLQEAGLATPHGSMANQVAKILTTQFGQFFMQPLVERTFQHFGESDAPNLTIRVGDAQE